MQSNNLLERGTSARQRAFTLIELLIVVAIIAILAAIAVPNFLEAQVRSKVSRVKADMRTMTTAIEAYIVDNNKLFPTNRSITANFPEYTPPPPTRMHVNRKLTTPISYMTSVFPDAFNIGNDPADSNVENRVIVIWGPDQLKAFTPATASTIFSPHPFMFSGTELNSETYLTFSIGPNQYYDVNRPTYPQPMHQYDSTNGTISNGDIIRFR